MTKIEMTNYGAKFNLRCPRCGNDEWSEKTYYSSHERMYKKCLHCGADIRTDTHTEIVIVIERPFMVFDEMTYNTIEKELQNDFWKQERP